MNNEELMSKDFQLFSTKGIVYTTALLRTVLENQAELMQFLKMPNSTNADINKKFNVHLKKVNDLYSKEIPNYDEVNPPLKD